MKKLFFICSILFLSLSAFASTQDLSAFNSIDKVDGKEKISLVVEVDGSKVDMIRELNSITLSDFDFFHCSFRVTVTWENGEQVSASFSSSNCKTARDAAVSWLQGLLEE